MKPEYADRYASLEDAHWWFRARRHILATILDREIAWRPGMHVLEVGVGPGANLAIYPADVELRGLEPDPQNAARADARGLGPVYAGTLEALPAPLQAARFDVVTLFDVLEHLADDAVGLAIVRAHLNPGGHIAVSVPAYGWLWSQQDVVSGHQRRYTLSALRRSVEAGGFRVKRATYFNTLLFPPIAVFRALSRLVPRQETGSDFDVGLGPVDALLHRVFAAEAHWLTRFDFPFGLSALVVAELDPGGS